MIGSASQDRQNGTGADATGTLLSLILVTSRPSVSMVYERLARGRLAHIALTVVPSSVAAVDLAAAAVREADLAVIDGGHESGSAREACHRLRALRPDLPLAVLFCCAHSATVSTVRSFLAAGVGSFLDLEPSPRQTAEALRSVARGEGVVHLQLTPASRAALFEGSDDQASELTAQELRLLRLVALGLSDPEIGEELCLSPHTIKHRIERLRHRVGARNRVQLATLAGRLEATGQGC